ncbi:VCBS domain-containing protein [Mesorhizobium sp. B2-8-3]|uniref:VCBS domain-containing protein n=1 Tax=Mesorhizobium sp. B2-8-3 TaxID=2589905 RepID=UPI00112C288C|nr:VCBS domain-containing protein [Mesorhizobium sp. B2-8-3]TPJ36955.1 adhesin [Mesorhizobium sp. B2-8-3]
MATQQIADAGGTTVSFSNTPQAKDEAFYFSEDSTGVLILNVLANDLGGSAKLLYSIDNSISASTATKTPAPSDLLIRDTTYSSTNDNAGLTGTTDTSLLGARIWIASDGTIHYNTADINALLQSLAQGQVLTDKLTYAIQLGNGTLSWATTTIQFTGTNDKPVIGAATLVGAVTEDAHTPTETATGTIAFSDLDLTDVHVVSAVFKSTDYSGQLGSLAAVKTTDTTGTGSGGLITWTFSAADSALDKLAAGQVVHETYTVTLNDQHGGVVTRDVVIDIVGTNDAPVITSAAQSGNVSEGDGLPAAAQQASGQVTFSDVDTSDTHTLSVSVAATYGTASVDADGTWHYTVSDSGAVDALAAGEHLADSFTVQVDDQHGGLATQVVTIDIVGTNDAPVIGAATLVGAVTEDAHTPTETATGTIAFGDVDLTDLHLVSAIFKSTDYSGQLGSLAAVKTTDTTGTGSGGLITWTFSAADSAVDKLAAGQVVHETYTVTLDDQHGGIVTRDVVITITGTNDNPTMSATATGSVTEDTPAGATETASGTVSFTDVDLTDTHTVTATFLSSTNAGGLQLGSLTAAKTLDTSGGTGGTGTWNYSVNNSAIQFLAAGQTVQETYQVTVADNHGGSTSQNVVVTVTGTNDAPVIDLNSGTAGISTSINYAAGSAATAIAPSGTVTDIDSADFNGGSLTVALTANGTSADQLTVQNQGTGVGQIGVSGSNVTYQGTTIGAFSGGTNGSNLVVTFNANATQAAVAALADHILYSNATSPAATKTVTYTLVDGDGTANGGTDTGTATATINVTGGGQAPVVDLNGPGSGNDATASYPSQSSPLSIATSATITDADSTTLTSLTATLTNRPDDGIGNPKEFLSLTSTASTAASAAGLTVNYDTSTGILSITGSATVATYQTILRGLQYADTKTGAHDQTPRVINVIVSDGANTSISHSITVSVAKPAGTAGEPINLALSDPSHEGALVTVTVRDMPSGWSIDGATQNADGSWTIQTTAVDKLTVTTPTDYAGAAVLDVQMSWTNADGTTGNMLMADNVEAYAPGSPIFAWSGDDVLTGSSGHDLFVFSQPIGNDTVHSFDAAADQIDLIGYNGLASFGDLQTHIADDAHGNAVITLADGQSITLEGVHSSALGAGNFVFDQTPVVNNPGTMTLGDGALLPLSGTVNNSGLISLNSTGDETLLQVIQHGVTLQGGGQIVLSDNAANLISGTGPDVTLINVDNTISGAGQLGDGMLGIDNRGTIIATGTNALVIDTGGGVVTNSGTLEATGSGGLVVAGGVANFGMIEANGGNIIIHGEVTGDGDATIGNLSKLEFGAASSLDVTFVENAAGTLELDDSFDYSGRISGVTNDDKLDLNDILFGTGTTVAYQASQDGSGGTLTVSDGAHNATLHLLGTYDANGFKLADDGQGHTVVTYDPAEFTLTGVSGGTSEFAV